MAVAETGEKAAEAAGQPSSALMTYLADKWQELLVVAIIIAVLVYAVIYLRKRFPIVREFMVFLKERKLWWMTPIAIIFVLLALVIVTMEGAAIAPFIYALF